MTKNKLKLVTHNGSFHADDVFACATLSIMLEREGREFEVIRTRDEEVVSSGDYVFDIGGVYDADKNRFDHHQTGGAGKHDNGIEYSSFGLVWKKYGVGICQSEEVAQMIDKKLVSPIDAADNGINLVENKFEVTPYFIQNFFYSMYPTWKEGEEKIDDIFIEVVSIAKRILEREITKGKDMIEARSAVIDAYQNSKDKRIIVLDLRYPFEEILSQYPEPLFVIYPRKITNDWGARAMRADPKMFKNRKDFPASWGGVSSDELKKITKVDDAVFCHRALFSAVAKSKEGAIKLAELAVES